MRKVLAIVVSISLAVPVSKVFAEPGQYTATIVLPEVEVRSGPSPEFYATSKLHWGDPVRVLGQEGNWLAITPPSPDSFSWINASQVDQLGQAATVKTAEASLRVGSRLMNQEPTVERAKIKQGTQLTVIGKPEVGKDGTWVPVLPAPSEVRYIPVNAIRPEATVQQTAPPPMAIVPPAFNTPTMQSAIATSTGRNPLEMEAEKAASNGNYSAAIRLYEQLANQVSISDHSLAVKCLNRAEELRKAQHSTAAQQSTGRPADIYYSNNANGRQAPIPAYTYAPSTYPCVPASQPLSQYCYDADSAHTVRLVPPTTATASPSAVQSGQWYGPGRLRRAAFTFDGKQLYALETDNNPVLMYVTGAEGVNLTPYLGRTLFLFGAASYQGELRNNYMPATQVRVVP
jgi:hypothetical protein